MHAARGVGDGRVPATPCTNVALLPHSSQLGCQVAEPGPEVRGRWQKSSRKEMATSFKALERLKGRMYAFGFPKGIVKMEFKKKNKNLCTIPESPHDSL